VLVANSYLNFVFNQALNCDMFKLYFELRMELQFWHLYVVFVYDLFKRVPSTWNNSTPTGRIL
jgi:hypothetical protein